MDFSPVSIIEQLEGLDNVLVVQLVGYLELLAVGHLLFLVVLACDLGRVWLPWAAQVVLPEALEDRGVHPFAELATEVVL